VPGLVILVLLVVVVVVATRALALVIAPTGRVAYWRQRNGSWFVRKVRGLCF
jgi:hypothetical protein